MTKHTQIAEALIDNGSHVELLNLPEGATPEMVLQAMLEELERNPDLYRTGRELAFGRTPMEYALTAAARQEA